VDFTIVIELELSDDMTDVSAKQLPMSKCYCWQDADYEGITIFLANYDWTQLFSLNPSLNEMWSAFNDVMHCAIDMYVPAVSNSKRSQTSKRRYPQKIRKAFVRKRCLWRKYRADRSNW